MLGGIAAQRPLADQVLVETAQRGHAPRDARGPQPAGAQALEVLEDIVGADPAERTAMIAQETGEIGEIPAVRVESIPGCPPLSLEGAEILNDDIGHRVTTSDNITTVPPGEARSPPRVALRSRRSRRARAARRAAPAPSAPTCRARRWRPRRPLRRPRSWLQATGRR